MTPDKLINDLNNLTSKVENQRDSLTFWQLEALSAKLDAMYRIVKEKNDRRKGRG